MEERDPKRKGKNPRSVLWLALILANLSLGFTMEDKCSACNTIAGEIQIGLSNEKPRNHLDMRHRLDSKGQREGKVIDYRVSDLRVVELLDGLCEKMQDYTLEKLDTDEEIWVRVNDWDNLPADKDKQEARAYSKYISSFCGRLLEETEDELAELIKKGGLKPEQLSKVLCQDLSKHCVAHRDDDEL
ncbi:hypothetical protein IEQ34_001935 [Dendrobium chrysotoxum]|uniref:DUF3456 domain-containing protein n=1 Tax=Dendrobium chrysotoxum TaxID=161865 RepID=A0AAV7HKR7_DENCH|nr:hypothetical protein IEQ34_001935 [Dendrobium chrysotoxum]